MAAPLGNKNAAHKKPFEKSLLRALALHKEGFDNALTAIANQVVTKAMEGEKWAIEIIGDRLDGKPAQAIVGDPDKPILIKTIENVIIDPKG